MRTRLAQVSVAVFWGRERYVSILWRYLERNLRVNHGVLDEVLLLTKNRDDEAGAIGARAILDAFVAKCVPCGVCTLLAGVAYRPTSQRGPACARVVLRRRRRVE